MEKHKLLIATLIMFVLTVPIGRTAVLAKAPPGADLVDVQYVKGQGISVLSKYELFRSMDGVDWLPAGFSDRAMELTAVGFGKDLFILATRQGTLYRSLSGGAFQEIKPPKDPYGRPVTSIRFIAVAPKGQEVLASSGQGLIRSADRGATWEPIADPFWSKPDAREVIAVGYAKAKPVIVTRRGVYRQGKKGFELLTKGLPQEVRPTVASVFEGKVLLALPGDGIYLATKDSAFKKLKSAPGDPIAFLGFAGKSYLASRVATILHKGDTSGKNWSPVGQYSPSFIPTASVSTPVGDFILIRGKGLVKLEGDSFVPVELPANLSSVMARLVVQGNLLAGTQGGIYLSANAGRTWEDVTPDVLGAAVNCFLPITGGRILLGSEGAGVFVSSDNGRSWKNWSNKLGTANTIKGLVEYGGGVLAATENGLMWTGTDEIPDWQWRDGGIGRTSVNAILREGNRYWVATQKGVFTAGDGKDFMPVPGLEGRVNSISVEDGNLLALVGGKMLLQKKGGKAMKLPRESGFITSVIALESGRVYAGSNNGLYRLEDAGWVLASGTRHPVAQILKDKGGLRVVTRGAGTYPIK